MGDSRRAGHEFLSDGSKKKTWYIDERSDSEECPGEVQVEQNDSAGILAGMERET